ncbi:organic cation transporter protein [Plakobranchus ocellatus]|uniref:Organic cation transporter protein n=1 Tax=Plakobranchus ocellatus TaxID=259542 RepID=A0AAV4B5D2_9GAST|nr:organic cation transporter protein [Plakobranchus ocellatus]
MYRLENSRKWHRIGFCRYAGLRGGVGGTVDSESTLRSAGALLSQARIHWRRESLPSSAMKFDDIISYLGQFGPYQRRVYALICVPSVAIGMQTLATVFTMAVPHHRCTIPSWPDDKYDAQSPAHSEAISSSIPPGDKEFTWSPCSLYSWRDGQGVNNSYRPDTFAHWNGSDLGTNQTTACTRWVYDSSVYESTLISRFDMVCENKLRRSHVQMFFMLGSLCGTLFLGPPADYFGRRKVMMVTIFLQLASSASIAFAPNYGFLCFCMMMHGAAMSAFYVVLFVIGG